MTRDQITQMAQEAGLTTVYAVLAEHDDGTKTVIDHRPFLERFAALVAAAEREACAQVCDEKVAAEYATGKVDHNEMGWTQACAISIRARGNA